MSDPQALHKPPHPKRSVLRLPTPQTARRAHFQHPVPQRQCTCRSRVRDLLSPLSRICASPTTSLYRAEGRTTRGVAGSKPAAPARSNLLAFYERFEVVESVFETLAIHALNDERIGELA